jgi:tripartite-type tricarboxylate transporter receptor subunit TctC
MPNFDRAVFVFTLVALGCLAGDAAAQATAMGSGQAYPSKPVRMIAPYPPGGSSDVLARIVAQKLSEALGRPVVVENRPGAAANVGHEIAAKATPDGYTLLLTSAAALVTNQFLYKKLNFDPYRDFVPISLVATAAPMLVVHPSIPAKSVQEFIAYAKTRPGQLNFGSGGVGTTSHIVGEVFQIATGVKMVHVPYKGGPLALNDLIAGHIQLIIEVSPVVNEQVLAGTIKGLAVSSPYRQKMLPNVPTFEEAGVPGVEVTGWLGIYGPPGLPEDVRQKLSAAIVEVVKQPETAKKLRAIGFEPTAQNVKRFTAYHAAEVRRWVAFYTDVGLRK